LHNIHISRLMQSENGISIYISVDLCNQKTAYYCCFTYFLSHMKPCFSVAGCNCPEMDVRMFCGTNQIHNWPLGKEVSECLEWEQIQLSGFKHRQGTHVHNVSMVLYNAELKIFQDQGTALTSCVLTWSLGKVIPEDLYANMTVLQILKICHFVPF
jgi:hypothetical protein